MAMKPFTVLDARAAPLLEQNVNTDIIIPIHRLRDVPQDKLGAYAFEPWRYLPDGSDNPDFFLNKPAYKGAEIVIADNNFACGSSREGAVWAIMGMGVKAVIAPSFGPIFFNNCFQNGVLPIRVSREDLDKLMDDAERGANATMTIDLEAQEIHGPDGGVVKFDIDAFRKHCMLNGLDDIGLTMQKDAGITSYEDGLSKSRPWA